MILIDSQVGGNLATSNVCNPGLLKKISELENNAKESTHFYLGYCCQLGYHRQVQETLEKDGDEFKSLTESMPNQEICKPTFQYVKNKKQRDASMSSDANDAADQKSKSDIIGAEVELIMQVISQKGDQSQALNELLDDKTKITTEGDLLIQVLFEVIFTKFGSNQLEHITRGIDRTKGALKPRLNTDSAQKVVLDTIFKSFNLDSLQAQDYSKENLFQLREKVNNLVLRLVQIGLLNVVSVINWCIDQLDKYDGPLSQNFAHFQLVLILAGWSQS